MEKSKRLASKTKSCYRVKSLKTLEILLRNTFCSTMASSSLFSSPVNPHFFQPLLPGFKTHLVCNLSLSLVNFFCVLKLCSFLFLQLIPVAFYSKHLEGKEEGNVVTLISDALEITWKLTMDGRRFTSGWEKFAVAHSLKVGDILVFRHEGNLMFHVTPLGPSCCEILYSHDDHNLTSKFTSLVPT